MADELDGGLEARLRAALHAEADALAFSLTAADVAAARRRRRGRSFALPASLLGAAAAIVLLAVAAGMLSRAPEPVAGTPPAAAGAANGTVVSSLAADCIPLQSADQGRGLTLRHPGLPYTIDVPGIGVRLWRGNAPLPSASLADAWPIDQAGLIGVEREGFVLDAGAHCVTRWTLDLASLPAARAAIAGGRRPDLRPVTSLAPSDGHRLTVTGLPAGEQILRLRLRWHIVGGGEDEEAWLLRVLVDDLAAPPQGSPAATPSPSPAIPTVTDLGLPGEAIVISTEGDPARPEAILLEAILYEVAGGGFSASTRDLARIDGVVLGPDQELVAPIEARLSPSGRLALSVTDAGRPAILLLDLRTGGGPETIVGEGVARTMAFGPDGRIAAISEAGALDLETAQGSFAPAQVGGFAVEVVDGAPVWLADGSGVITTTRGDGGVTTFGALGPDGYRPLGTSPPSLSGTTGVERPFDATGHRLGKACDTTGNGGTGGDAICVLVRSRDDAAPERWGDARFTDAMSGSSPAWAADGTRAWVLQLRSRADGILEAFIGRTDGSGVTDGEMAVESGVNTMWEDPAILGLSEGAGEGPLAVVLSPTGRTFLVGTGGATSIADAATGNAAFVGWAGGSGAYPAR